MSETIIGMVDWLQTPAGQYLQDWERSQLDAAVTDIFGYHALQLGLPQIDGLHANRMPYRWLALDTSGVVHHACKATADATLVTDFCALPFPSSSLDLLVLPHTLEFSADPHATLREVERVLVPEGRVVICGMNPASLWGFKQMRRRLYRRLGLGRGRLYLPEGGEFIGPRRLKDWLRLLSFEVEATEYGCYRPAFRTEKWLERFAWMDRAGARSWPILGAAYFFVAVKRVRGMRMLGPAWKAQPVRVSRQASVTHSVGDYSKREKSID